MVKSMKKNPNFELKRAIKNNITTTASLKDSYKSAYLILLEFDWVIGVDESSPSRVSPLSVEHNVHVGVSVRSRQFSRTNQHLVLHH